MAKILDRDPVNYAKEKSAFLRDLQHFHENRGTPFRRIPCVNGSEIDLYLLYCLVTAQGGWMEVLSKLQLTKILSNCAKVLLRSHAALFLPIAPLGEVFWDTNIRPSF